MVTRGRTLDGLLPAWEDRGDASCLGLHRSGQGRASKQEGMSDSGKLDAAMSAAFGSHADTPAPSVLARLSAGGAPLSQVHLRHASSAGDQQLLSRARDGGRYRILGEIARGG